MVLTGIFSGSEYRLSEALLDEANSKTRCRNVASEQLGSGSSRTDDREEGGLHSKTNNL